jgi:hypothetical protein
LNRLVKMQKVAVVGCSHVVCMGVAGYLLVGKKTGSGGVIGRGGHLTQQENRVLPVHLLVSEMANVRRNAAVRP